MTIDDKAILPTKPQRKPGRGWAGLVYGDSKYGFRVIEGDKKDEKEKD